MNTIERKWANYFDKMGIQYLYKPTKFKKEDFTPTFYLPDYICFAQVTVGPYTVSDVNKAESLAKDELFPLLCLNKEPALTYYELLLPVEDSDKYKAILVNVVQDPESDKKQFLTDYIMEGEEAFHEMGFDKAVKAANS